MRSTQTRGNRSGGLAVRNLVGDFCHATVDCVACAPLVDLHHATPFVLRSKVLKQLAQKPGNQRVSTRAAQTSASSAWKFRLM